MPLRIGLIGAGGNTKSRHIPGFRAEPGVEIVAVANRSRESSEAVAREFGIPKVARSPEELIADPGVDAVCIGTWPNMHREYTIRALEAGKHVLCEARMAGTADEAEEMLQAHERYPHLVTQLVPAPFDFRLGPTITRLLREGAVGTVTEATVTMLNGSGLNPETPIHWRQQQRYSGRNVMTFGIFVEVIHRWLGETARVLADGAVVTGERPDGVGGRATVDVPDTYGVLARMANGALVSYRFSSVAAGAPHSGITIFGSRGTIRWSPDDTAAVAEHGQPFEPLEPDGGTDRGWRVEADFVASVRDGAPVRLTSFEDGMRYMRVIDGAWRSWQSGCAVECRES